MKIKIFLTLSFLPFVLYCQVIDSVNVYYLPWKFSIEGMITDDIVRTYQGYSKEVKIRDRDVIDKLVLSLSIFNMRQKEDPPKESFSPRMVIDVFSHLKASDPNSPVCVYTIKLDQRQNLVFRDYVYYKNFFLEKWIKENIPEENPLAPGLPPQKNKKNNRW